MSQEERTYNETNCEGERWGETDIKNDTAREVIIVIIKASLIIVIAITAIIYLQLI